MRRARARPLAHQSFVQFSHHNWIDGAPRPALSEETFELKVAGTRETLGRWPRSGPRDLELALASCTGGPDADSWRRAAIERRRTLLSDAIDVLLDDPAAEESVARGLGLRAAEIDAFIESLEWALDDLLDGVLDTALRGVPASRGGLRADGLLQGHGGPLVLVLDWSEMWLASARLVFRALLSGQSVIVVPDPRAPAIGDTLARALSALPRGAFQVVHDDNRTVMRAALDDERVAALHLPSTMDAVVELSERDSTPRVVRIASGFGAGVDVQGASKLHVRSLANRSFVVREDDDLLAQAGLVCRRAFGRIDALSGAAPGRIGRVLIEKRAFSAFTETLLEALEASVDAASPIDATRAALTPHVERAFALGHDEGATAIFTGFEKPPLAFPLVFTNVEERMRLARLARPAPVVCLMRVADEAHGRALAARLDG